MNGRSTVVSHALRSYRLLPLQCGNSAINSCIRGLHETPALLEQIAAPVSRFHLITDYMRSTGRHNDLGTESQ